MVTVNKIWAIAEDYGGFENCSITEKTWWTCNACTWRNMHSVTGIGNEKPTWNGKLLFMPFGKRARWWSGPGFWSNKIKDSSHPNKSVLWMWKTRQSCSIFNLKLGSLKPHSRSYTYCTYFTWKLANQVLIQYNTLCEVGLHNM